MDFPRVNLLSTLLIADAHHLHAAADSRGFRYIERPFYRDGWLYNDDRPRPLTITKPSRLGRTGAGV
jgi:hypothetical protein